VIAQVSVKVSRSGVAACCAFLGAWLLLFDSSPLRMVGVFAFFIALAIVFAASLLVSWMGNVWLDEGVVEKVTSLGGVIRIRAADLDLDCSALSAQGLRLVPRTGEAIFLSATQYSQADLLQVADHVGLARSDRRYA
jgi:hypothetical protein